MYDNSQALKERVSAQQLADKVAFDERCMLNWHCCGARGKKKTMKEKKNNPPKIFTPVKFDATTSKVWHRNMLADMKYVTGLQQGCSRWKCAVVLANTCQSVVVSWSLIWVNDFIGVTVVPKRSRRARAEWRRHFNKQKNNSQVQMLSGVHMWSLTASADEP